MAIGPILRNARLAKQLTESQVAELTRMKIQIVQDLEKDDFHRIAATIYGKGFIKLYAECVGLDPQPLINDYLRSVEGDSPSLIASQDERRQAHSNRPSTSSPKKTAKAKQSPPKVPATNQGDKTVEVAPENEEPDDLFSYTRRKNLIVDEDVHTEADGDKAQLIEQPPSRGEKLRHSLDEMLAGLSRWWSWLLDRLAEIEWGDRPIKIVGGVVALLVVLLIIVTVARGCSSSPERTQAGSTELRVGAPLPEPYFD